MNKQQVIQVGIFAGVFAAGAVAMRIGTSLTNSIRLRRATDRASVKRNAEQAAQPADAVAS